MDNPKPTYDEILSFDTGDISEDSADIVKVYIDLHREKLKASAPKPAFPIPPLIFKIEECIQDIFDNPEHYPDLNLAILRLSSPFEWATELYYHATEEVKALCSRSSQPQDLSEYCVKALSTSMTVYLSFVQDKFYTGSGTSVSHAGSEKHIGGYARQMDRGLKRKPSNRWHKAILAAAKEGHEPQWVPAIDIRIKKIDQDSGLES